MSALLHTTQRMTLRRVLGSSGSFTAFQPQQRFIAQTTQNTTKKLDAALGKAAAGATQARSASTATGVTPHEAELLAKQALSRGVKGRPISSSERQAQVMGYTSAAAVGGVTLWSLYHWANMSTAARDKNIDKDDPRHSSNFNWFTREPSSKAKQGDMIRIKSKKVWVGTGEVNEKTGEEEKKLMIHPDADKSVHELTAQGEVLDGQLKAVRHARWGSSFDFRKVYWNTKDEPLPGDEAAKTLNTPERGGIEGFFNTRNRRMQRQLATIPEDQRHGMNVVMKREKAGSLLVRTNSGRMFRKEGQLTRQLSKRTFERLKAEADADDAQETAEL